MSFVSVEVLAIVFLIAANGVFALSEIAVVSARKARLQQRSEQGSKGAKLALRLANEPNQFLSTVQIGMTLIGTLAGAFGGATIAKELAKDLSSVPLIGPHARSIALGFVVLAISYLSLMLGELVPKRLALSNPERFASAVAPAMSFLARAASPAVRFLSWSSEAVLRLLPIRTQQEPSVTEEEIKVMIEEGTKSGEVDEAEQEMVEGVFRLGDRRVGDLMTPRPDVTWLDVRDDVREAQSLIAHARHSRFPVAEESLDRLLGYVHVKDLLNACMENKPFDLRRCLRPAPVVPETVAALRVLDIFEESGSHIAFIIDEHGMFQGIVTLTDIVGAVVGHVPSLPGPQAGHMIKRDDGSWLVDGITPVWEFEEALGIRELSGEDEGAFTTMGGFVMLRLGRVPRPGDHFAQGGWRYEVVDMDGNRVDKVLVSAEENGGAAGPAELLG
ncbi:MAG: hemolysin family protein [Bryobacteraceae bacterium]|jgi:putative hemolysin